MTDDIDQLRQYWETGSEDAFRGLVERLLPLVFSTALRRVNGDVHLAQDVAQLVFVALARNARGLAGRTELAGWLFTTTRNLAAKAVRTASRRRAREAAAMSLESPTEAERDEAPSLQPVIDELLTELRPADQQVLLLRFYQGLRLAEIGRRLDATENAVQKRLERATERLRDRLARRGITSTGIALAAALELQSAAAVPAGLAATAATAAVSAGSAGAAVWFIPFMATMKSQLALTGAVFLIGAASIGWIRRENAVLIAEIQRQSAIADAEAASLGLQVTQQEVASSAAQTDLIQIQDAILGATSSLNSRELEAQALRTFRERLESLRLEGASPADILAILVENYRNLRSHQPLVREYMGQQQLSSQIARLGDTYPPALNSLRGLRDEAVARFYEDPGGNDAGREAAMLNNRLKEDAASLPLIDALPEGETENRRSMALNAMDALIEAQRYEDALFGMPFSSMLSLFDAYVRIPRMGVLVDGEMQPAALVFGGKYIEILAGTGRDEDTKFLTDRMMAYDDSEDARKVIQQHVDRARSARGE